MSQKLGLVIGGSTTIGKSVIRTFKNSWKMTSLDFNQNEEIEQNIILNKEKPLKSQIQSIYDSIHNFQSKDQYNAIIYVGAQAFQDNAQLINVLENYQKAQQNITQQALLASHLSTKYLQNSGLMVLQGCQKQTCESRNEHLSYTLAISAIPTLVSNTAAHPSMQDKTAVALLVEDIDTQENRELDPSGSYSKWIEPESLSGLMKMWADGLNLPKSGSYAVVKNNKQKLANPEFIEEI